MKILITLLFFLIQYHAYSQNFESAVQVDELIKLESSKIEIIIHSTVSDHTELDSVSVKSTYFETVDFETEILAFNISGIDSKGSIVFTLYPKGNVISQRFKNRFTKCYQCESIRIDKIKIKWYNNGSYILRKRKQWKNE